MRILFISHYSELYGANRSLLTLLEYYNKRADYVIRLLLPSRGNLVKELKKKDIGNEVIPYISQLWYYKLNVKYLLQPFLILFTIVMLPYIVYRVYRFKPDLIYSNTSAENMGILIAKILGIKHISHIREFMDLDFSAHFIGGNKLKRKYFGMSDGVIYVSQSLANWINSNEPLSSNQIVIYNGIQVNNTIRYKTLESERPINLGIVGIFDEAKGQHLAIQYFYRLLAEMPSAMLHLYGDKRCKYKQKLYTLVEKLDIKNRVVFHGFVKDPATIYKEMDALLMFSRMEGFGRVTVEAMQYGVPVIGYNSGGTAEIIIHGKNGFLFDDERQFVEAVKNLFSSPVKYKEMSKNACTDSCERFSVERYCNTIEKFVCNIVSSS